MMNWMDDQPERMKPETMAEKIARQERRHANPWRFVPLIVVGVAIWLMCFWILLTILRRCS